MKDALLMKNARMIKSALFMQRLQIFLVIVLFMAWAACIYQLPGIDWHSIGLPAGQNYYRFSKFAALTAILLMSLQVCSGFLKKRGHAVLGSSVLLCTLTHYLSFFYAVNLRQGHLPNFLLWPWPVNEYYNGALTIGWLSLLMLIVMAISGACRHLWPRIMRVLHHTWLAMVVGAILHSAMIGGEMQSLAGRCFYLAILLNMMLASFQRYAKPLSKYFPILIPLRATSV